MRVIALFSTSFFAKYLRVVEDGPGQGHLCHTDTFLVLTYNTSRVQKWKLFKGVSKLVEK